MKFEKIENIENKENKMYSNKFERNNIKILSLNRLPSHRLNLVRLREFSKILSEYGACGAFLSIMFERPRLYPHFSI